ncbi:MAG: hypothetical protein IIA50_02150, partial [Bacteroidetes bacterium]|nr:hypothetical protein [Bacteroidota bacterium]
MPSFELALADNTLVIRDDQGAERCRLTEVEVRQAVRHLRRLNELVTVVERRGMVFTELLAM